MTIGSNRRTVGQYQTPPEYRRAALMAMEWRYHVPTGHPTRVALVLLCSMVAGGAFGNNGDDGGVRVPFADTTLR